MPPPHVCLRSWHPAQSPSRCALRCETEGVNWLPIREAWKAERHRTPDASAIAQPGSLLPAETAPADRGTDTAGANRARRRHHAGSLSLSGCEALIDILGESCPADPAESGRIDWTPDVLHPVFFGFKDISTTSTAGHLRQAARRLPAHRSGLRRTHRLIFRTLLRAGAIDIADPRRPGPAHGGSHAEAAVLWGRRFHRSGCDETRPQLHRDRVALGRRDGVRFAQTRAVSRAHVGWVGSINPAIST